MFVCLHDSLYASVCVSSSLCCVLLRISDVHDYVQRCQRNGSPFILTTSLPFRELREEELSLEQADLANAVIVQRPLNTEPPFGHSWVLTNWNIHRDPEIPPTGHTDPFPNRNIPLSSLLKWRQYSYTVVPLVCPGWRCCSQSPVTAPLIFIQASSTPLFPL